MNMSHWPQVESPWPHRVALLLACAVFPLIWVGGLVTTYAAGMAVYDWPTTFGYNPLAYPLSTWWAGPFDIFVEHGHRLLGMVAGLLTLALVASVYYSDSRRWMKFTALAALAAVCAQGALGGLRVLLDGRVLALWHGCVGPAFFALCVALVVFTSRSWKNASRQTVPGAGALQVLALLTTALAYLQLVLGAQLRHVPVTATPTQFRAAVVFHVGVAFVLAFQVGVLASRIWLRYGNVPLLTRTVSLLALLVALQLVLGSATWLCKFAWPGSNYTGGVIVAQSFSRASIITAHVATGSLVVATSLVVSLWSFRLLRGAPAVAIGPVSLLLGVAP